MMFCSIKYKTENESFNLFIPAFFINCRTFLYPNHSLVFLLIIKIFVRRCLSRILFFPNSLSFIVFLFFYLSLFIKFLKCFPIKETILKTVYLNLINKDIYNKNIVFIKYFQDTSFLKKIS